MRNMTDKEFDFYMERELYNYLCQLERDQCTDECIFMYNIEKLINSWKDILYTETGKRNNTVQRKDIPKVAVTIAKSWNEKKNTVVYVNSRVTITEEALTKVCEDILDKFYINPPDTTHTLFLQ